MLRCLHSYAALSARVKIESLAESPQQHGLDQYARPLALQFALECDERPPVSSERQSPKRCFVSSAPTASRCETPYLAGQQLERLEKSVDTHSAQKQRTAHRCHASRATNFQGLDTPARTLSVNASLWDLCEASQTSHRGLPFLDPQSQVEAEARPQLPCLPWLTSWRAPTGHRKQSHKNTRPQAPQNASTRDASTRDASTRDASTRDVRDRSVDDGEFEKCA